jgi:YD repeat-containing protein
MTNRRVRFYSRLLAVLFFAALPVLTPHPSSAIDSCTAAPTTNCTGFQGWYEPVVLNSSYPWFGSYIKVMANYNTGTNCDGRATKHADTGTWQNYATKQTSDGYTGYVCMPPTVPQGYERTIRVGMTSAMSGFVVTGTVDTHYAQGGFTNDTRTEDTVTCDVTGAGPTQLTDIPFELCYDYSTSAGGYSVNHQPNDATTFLQIARSSGDNYSWDTANGYDIQHTNGQNQQSVCNTGKFIVQGTQGIFYVTMSADDAGTQYIATQNGPAARQGNFQTYFQITSKPTGVTCTSKSGVFPGGDGPTREEREAQKESDQSGGDPCASAGGDRDNPPEYADVSTAPETANNEPSKFIGNPIDFAQGFKVENEVDYIGPGGLNFIRTYRSQGTWINYAIGKYWRHNFNRSLVVDTALPAKATLTDENGVVTLFRQTTSGGAWKPYDYEITAKFESLYNSVPALIGYAYTRDDNTREIYNTTGKLTRIEYLGSVALNLAYDGSGRLSSVTDEHGRSLTFTYDGSSRIATLVTPDGTYTYSYGANNNLTQVTKPDTKTRLYHYENATFVNALTGITDERGIRISTWGYNAQGLATSSENAGPVNDFTVAYNSDGTVTATNPLGKQTKFTFANLNNVKKIITSDGIASANCPASTKTASYTAQGWVSETKTDWEGNTTRYVYDSRGLETSRTEAVWHCPKSGPSPRHGTPPSACPMS